MENSVQTASRREKVRSKVREGKKSKKFSKKKRNNKSRYDLFEDDSSQSDYKAPNNKQRRGRPVMSKSKRNQLLRSLNSGEDIEINYGIGR